MRTRRPPTLDLKKRRKVRVYDLVDWVSRDSEIAGRSAAEYAMKGGKR